MQWNIIKELKTQLEKITGLYVGYYPYDFKYITMKMPALLIQLNNSTVQSYGHHKYDVIANTTFILYSTDSFQTILNLQQSIVDTIIQKLHDISGYCVKQIGNIQIQAGDINQYILPSDTGYNANVVVRKITQNYTFTKII